VVDQAREIWGRMRRESNVDLGGIALKSAAFSAAFGAVLAQPTVRVIRFPPTAAVVVLNPLAMR